MYLMVQKCVWGIQTTANSKQSDQLVPALACWRAYSSSCHISIWQSDLWTRLPLEVNGSSSPPSVFSLGRSNHSKHCRTQRKQWKRRKPPGWLSVGAERVETVSFWLKEARRREQRKISRQTGSGQDDLLYDPVKSWMSSCLHVNWPHQGEVW